MYVLEIQPFSSEVEIEKFNICRESDQKKDILINIYYNTGNKRMGEFMFCFHSTISSKHHPADTKSSNYVPALLTGLYLSLGFFNYCLGSSGSSRIKPRERFNFWRDEDIFLLTDLNERGRKLFSVFGAMGNPESWTYTVSSKNCLMRQQLKSGPDKLQLYVVSQTASRPIHAQV